MRLSVDLDDSAAARLERYVALLSLWNRRGRMTAERDASAIVSKHVLDCLAPVPHLPRRGPVVDVGSGAGLPGIVVACVRPDLEIVLLESRRRRVSFLREAIRTIGLGRVEALEMRAEDAVRGAALEGRCPMALGRAIRLEQFLGLARPLLAPGGVALAMQTPRTASAAVPLARRCGFRIAQSERYVLPDGAARCLLFCTLFPGKQGAVS